MQQVLRDPMSMFFAIIFPVLLVTAFSLIYGSEVQWGGLPLPQYLAAAFAVYGVGTMAFVNLPGSIADQRALGVLKRMRGTPLPPLLYLVGRVLAALVLGLATLVLVFVVAVAFLTVSLPPSTWAATLLTFVLAILCFAACGLALVSLVDSPQAVIALALSHPAATVLLLRHLHLDRGDADDAQRDRMDVPAAACGRGRGHGDQRGCPGRHLLGSSGRPRALDRDRAAGGVALLPLGAAEGAVLS